MKLSFTTMESNIIFSSKEKNDEKRCYFTSKQTFYNLLPCATFIKELKFYL